MILHGMEYNTAEGGGWIIYIYIVHNDGETIMLRGWRR
jgi:hypothetical protein